MNKKERNARCHAEGRCPNCFRKHNGEYLYCDACLEKRKHYIKRKPCKGCGAELPPRSRLHYCKTCRDKRPNYDWRNWFYNLPADKQRQIRENGKRAMAQYREQHPEEFHDKQLNYRYGISHSIALDMYTKQDGKCAICHNQLGHLFDKNVARKDKPHIDHNHETGKVRALLCIACNHLIGDCKEDISILLSAIEFIKIHNHD